MTDCLQEGRVWQRAGYMARVEGVVFVDASIGMEMGVAVDALTVVRMT